MLPSYAVVTEGRVHESRIARTLRFKPGAIVVFDRGYKDKRIEQDKLAITIRHRILAAALAKVAMPLVFFLSRATLTLYWHLSTLP